MSDKKNIERLFQEKFKDFEAIPSSKVWENIEAELHKKKRRRVIPIWFKLSGVAALLLVGALIGYGILNQVPNVNPDNGVVNQENFNSDDNRGKKLIPTKNPVQSNEIVTDAENSQNSGFENSSSISSENENPENNGSSKEALDKTKISSEDVNSRFENTSIANAPKNKSKKQKNSTLTNEAIANSSVKSNASSTKKTSVSPFEKNRNNALAVQEKSDSKENSGKVSSLENNNLVQNNSIASSKIASEKNKNVDKTQIAFDKKALEIQKKDSTAVATVVPNPLEELLLQQEKEKQVVTEPKVNRWQITSNVAPIYFSSAANGSPISEELADNNKSFEKNLSYGVGLNYSLSNKWSVRSGVNKLTLGYNTNNIVYYAGLPNEARNANTFQAKGSQIIIEDNSAANVVSFDNVPGKNNGYLNQSMGYIEVPVELSYKLLDRKFGIEVIGGMSTLFLNENKLSVVSNGFAASAGKADNLNDVSFSSNIGLGFKYNFWKSFQANIEPKLKYQLNTFSENNGGFKPYFVGIYSGLSFSF